MIAHIFLAINLVYKGSGKKLSDDLVRSIEQADRSES